MSDLKTFCEAIPGTMLLAVVWALTTNTNIFDRINSVVKISFLTYFYWSLHTFLFCQYKSLFTLCMLILTGVTTIVMTKDVIKWI